MKWTLYLIRNVSAGLALLAALTPCGLQAYLVGPPDGLDKMTTNADLVCKARVMDFQVITNDAFRSLSGFETRATRLEIISVLKGTVPAKSILFQHYASSPQGGIMSYSPQHYELEPGRSYLLFALKTGSTDTFRQIRMSHTGKMDEGVLRTVDARPLDTQSIKDAHWLELNRLLTDTDPANQIYAVAQLDAMSAKRGQSWGHSDDFQRGAVLKALWPLVASGDDGVALAALGCFAISQEDSALFAPFVEGMVQIASHGSSVPRRVAAMTAFSGTQFTVVSNALPQWLRDPAEDVRLQAVLLLPNYPGDISENALRKLAEDSSPKIRAGVAEAIGNGQLISLLPVLKALLGGGDSGVHAAAGNALLKFEVNRVSDILKANLNDEEFRPSYLCKLAEVDAGPWLTNLVEVLEARRIRVQKEVDASGIEPKANYLKARMALAGTYFTVWNLIEQYLEARPAADFAEGKLDRCLDALENAGTTGSREPTTLYELYLAKGLAKRAAEFRGAHGNSDAGYDIEQFYNRSDAKYAKSSAATGH